MMRLLLHKTRQSGCKELINHHKLDGDSALHLAARKGSLEIVKVLTEFGAKGAAFNKNQETPVYVAAKKNHWEVVEYLVERNKGAVVKNKCLSKSRFSLLTYYSTREKLNST